jgi:hypothetical protein
MDNRLRELVTKLADSAPPAPPFPQPASKPLGIGRRTPAWVLAVAGAAAVLLIIGVPFLLFSGGTLEDDVVTTPAPTPTTAIPATTTSTMAQATNPTCFPTGLLVRALAEDGASGHLVTPLRFTNVSGDPCVLDDPVSVTGIGIGGEEVPAGLGTYIPIGGPGAPLIDAGGSRVMLVEVGTGCEGGRLIGPEAESVRITLAGGDVIVPFTGDLGCQFSYSAFGEWLEAEPVTDAERALFDSLTSFALDPNQERFVEIPFADAVTLTLGPQLARDLDASNLADPAAWMFGTEYDGFRARVAPFSALDLLGEDRATEVTSGTRDHCASPPMPVYEDFFGLRQISIQPTDATSCLEWWAVDLFLLETGEIAGVTLDLWEP